MALKFYSSVTKGLKLKIRKFKGANSYISTREKQLTREKLVGKKGKTKMHLLRHFMWSRCFNFLVDGLDVFKFD